MTTITKLTADVDPRFEIAFPRACEQIGCKPIDLLGVMMSESGVQPAARNLNGDASGLIQFMPATLRGLGWRGGAQAFRCLTASQQCTYVAAYFSPWKKDGAPFDSAGRVYQAVFLPGTLRTARKPSDVLCAKRGALGWAYEANAVFDADGDGRITISELSASVHRACKGPRWRELLGRLGLQDAPPALEDVDGDGLLEVTSVYDVQVALAILGVASLDADGICGPATRQAVRDFQARSKLHVDGIAGPETRAALSRAINGTAETQPELPES